MDDPTVSLGLLEASWRDFILGVVQGLTEFLPISSTAHLKVVPVMLGWGVPVFRSRPRSNWAASRR